MATPCQSTACGVEIYNYVHDGPVHGIVLSIQHLQDCNVPFSRNNPFHSISGSIALFPDYCICIRIRTRIHIHIRIHIRIHTFHFFANKFAKYHQHQHQHQRSHSHSHLYNNNNYSHYNFSKHKLLYYRYLDHPVHPTFNYFSDTLGMLHRYIPKHTNFRRIIEILI